jgi:hypothetical protein
MWLAGVPCRVGLANDRIQCWPARTAPAGPWKIMAMPAIVILVLSASRHPIVASTVPAARNRVVWSAG